MARLTIETASGPAWVDLELAAGATTLLVVGHGAGGSVDSADLVSVRDACVAAGISVARVTQPYRVAGKKAPPTAASLDLAWSTVVLALGHRKAIKDLRFVFAGRSSGARVACRTSTDPSLKPPAQAVVAIAFPVHPPGKPEKSRLDELDAVSVPVLVVQGRSDSFGQPPQRHGRNIVSVDGDHSLKKSAGEVGPIVADWVGRLNLSGG